MKRKAYVIANASANETGILCRRVEEEYDLIPISPRLGLSWVQDPDKYRSLRFALLAGCDEVHVFLVDASVPPLEVQIDMDLAAALGKPVEITQVSREDFAA